MTRDGVVDDDIDAAEPRDRSANQPFDLRQLRDVGLFVDGIDAKCARQLLLRGGTFLGGRDAVQDDVAALRRQRLGDGKAQPRGRTGDQGTPVGKDGGHLRHPRDA